MNFVDKLKGLSRITKLVTGFSVLAVAAIAVICIILGRNNYLATTMRLLRVEGTVNIEDARGTSKPVADMIRFQSGDALNTGSDGLASVGLDDTKIITLQNDSRAEFLKNRKKIELKLTKGGLFFEVTEKLGPDETFEIKTSNMTAGIRGTSGYVFYDETGLESLIVTDGAVEVSATNPVTGETKTIRVEGGQSIKVYLYSDRTEDSVEFYLENLTEEDLPYFPLKVIAGNDKLIDRICEYTGWDRQKLIEVINRALNPDAAEPTATPTPTPMPTPSNTATPTPSPTMTDTPTPTATPTSTPKPAATSTPNPTATPTPSETPTPTPKPTPEIPLEELSQYYNYEKLVWDVDSDTYVIGVNYNTYGQDYIAYDVDNGSWERITYRSDLDPTGFYFGYYDSENPRLYRSDARLNEIFGGYIDDSDG